MSEAGASPERVAKLLARVGLCRRWRRERGIGVKEARRELALRIDPQRSVIVRQSPQHGQLRRLQRAILVQVFAPEQRQEALRGGVVELGAGQCAQCRRRHR